MENTTSIPWHQQIWNIIVDAFLWFILEVGPRILIAAIIVIVGWWLSKKIMKISKKALIRANVEEAATSFLCQIILGTLRIFIVIMAISQLGVDVSSIVTALLGATVAISLALKDSLSNFASGMLIIINKPFKKDDFVEFEGLTGTVKRIELMNTILSTVDNKEVIIPNARITTNNLINYSALTTRRLDLKYNVAYDSDLKLVKELLWGLVNKNEKFLQDPKPIIGISSHDDSSIAVDVKVWCSKEDYWDLFYEMQEKVKYTFDENNIDIPFDQLVVHMHK